MTDLLPPKNLKLAVPFFMVTSIQTSLDFYVKGLGFQIKFDWKPAGRIEWCWLQREEVAFMLQEFRLELRPKDKVGVGVTICVVCENAIALYHEFLEKGLKPAEPLVGNNMWVTALEDPDGYKINFESSTDAPEEMRYSEWVKRGK